MSRVTSKEGERGCRRSVRTSQRSEQERWAAGEYVADCHESGELSLVKGGVAALHRYLQIDREFFYYSKDSRFIFGKYWHERV